MIVGLFFDYKYHFEGINKIDVNEVCDKASAAAMNMKNDAKTGVVVDDKVCEGEVVDNDK